MKENHYNCIYMYINKINNHKYIGKAKDFNERHKQHLRGKELLIDKKIKEYGSENFDIIILAENIDNEKIDAYEQFFIKRYNTLAKNKNGYNIAIGGNGGNLLIGKSEKEIEEFKNKCKKRKGNLNGMYGKHHTYEQRKKWSEERKGNASYCYGKFGKDHASTKELIAINIETFDIYENIYGIREAKEKFNLTDAQMKEISRCCTYYKNILNNKENKRTTLKVGKYIFMHKDIYNYMIGTIL